MDSFRRVAGAAMLALLVTSCSSPTAEPADGVTRTVTALPSTADSPRPTSSASRAEPSETVSAYPPPVVDDQTVAFPRELVGTWQSVDQGSAEDLIEIHADGSYVRAMLLMQQRPSGVFSFSIGTTGQVLVAGSTLRLAPTSGTESMSDPDAPSASYTDRSLEDLTPDVFQWSLNGGSLWLNGKYGLVEFRPTTG